MCQARSVGRNNLEDTGHRRENGITKDLRKSRLWKCGSNPSESNREEWRAVNTTMKLWAP